MQKWDVNVISGGSKMLDRLEWKLNIDNILLFGLCCWGPTAKVVTFWNIGAL